MFIPCFGGFGTTSPTFPASDDFRQATLDARWTVEDPLTAATVSLDGDGTDWWLDAVLPAAQAYNQGSSATSGALRVMQTANNSDLDVRARFLGGPSGGSSGHGLLVSGSDAGTSVGVTWVRFDIFHDGTEFRVFSGSRASANGTLTSRVNTGLGATMPQYLRLTRVGDTWTGYTSTDGTNWTQRVQFTHAFTVAKAGVFFGSPTDGYTGRCDWFQSGTNAIPGEDGFVTAWKFPGSAAQNASGTDAWSNFTSVRLSAVDASNASVAALNGSTADISNHGIATNFGLTSSDVPSGATIRGVEVRLTGVSSFNAGRFVELTTCMLTKDGTNAVGSNRPDTTPIDSANTSTLTQGGGGDLWGTTLTQAEVIATTFGVMLQFSRGADTADNTTSALLDALELRVFYST